MKRHTLAPVLALALLFTACAKPAVEPAQPAVSEILIVPEIATEAVPESVLTDAAPATEPPAASAAEGAENLLFSTAEIAAIPSVLADVTAGMTQTVDEMGRLTYSDGARTVTPFEWNIEGENAHIYKTEAGAYRLLGQYAPDGKLILITAVPLSTIDPNVCPDAYAFYTELYRYADRYYGCMRNTTADGVVLQEMFAPDGAPLFSVAITLDVYGEAEHTALYDASGALVCASERGEADACFYTDGTGAAISQSRYDELILNVSGDWLNDYYGAVYGA